MEQNTEKDRISNMIMAVVILCAKKLPGQVVTKYIQLQSESDLMVLMSNTGGNLSPVCFWSAVSTLVSSKCLNPKWTSGASLVDPEEWVGASRLFSIRRLRSGPSQLRLQAGRPPGCGACLSSRVKLTASDVLRESWSCQDTDDEEEFKKRPTRCEKQSEERKNETELFNESSGVQELLQSWKLL